MQRQKQSLSRTSKNTLYGGEKKKKQPAPRLQAEASPHSDSDLVIYSFLPWSQHFAKTASTIQEHINNQGQSRGLAGQLEQNPNK